MNQHKKKQPGSKRSTRNKNSYRNRRNSTRGQKGQPLKRFLIVCEGTETEPNYFEVLGRKLKGKVILKVRGEGKVTLSLVKEAKRLKDEDGDYSQNKDEGDEVWCVFDRDFKSEPNNQQNFNQAIILAHNNNINLAISNDAFELWFLLHFSYYTSNTNRNVLKSKLTEKWQANTRRMIHCYMRSMNGIWKKRLRMLKNSGIVTINRLSHVLMN